MSYIEFRNKRINFSQRGKGKTIVLLHGYPASSDIWKKFIRVLSTEFRVIAIDLPGHGKSDIVSGTHTIGLMAEVVHAVLKEQKVRQCLMIGHSMGGFTTLEFAERYPEMLKGFGLFHSHPFEDSPETKLAREKFIELIRKDKLEFLNRYFALLFSEKTRNKFTAQIRKMILAASKMPDDALIAAMRGMKLRKDRTRVLKNTKVPVLFIIGLQDSRFPVSRAWEIVSLPRHSEVLLLKSVAHMGFIEDEKATLNAVRSFARNVLVS